MTDYLAQITQELKDGAVKDWSRYAPYFTEAETACKHTGLNFMQEHFMQRLLALRLYYGKPIILSSAYRHPTHPVEAKKKELGEHTRGIAVDATCWSDSAFELAEAAFKFGFTGIGVSQSPRSSARFVHLDTRITTPRLYSY